MEERCVRSYLPTRVQIPLRALPFYVISYTRNLKRSSVLLLFLLFFFYTHLGPFMPAMLASVDVLIRLEVDRDRLTFLKKERNWSSKA